MHIGEGFVFNLDTPREQPGAQETVQAAGWLAATEPITRIRVIAANPMPVTLSPRPDVQAIFPAYPHVTGFIGQIGGRDLRAGAVHVAFSMGNRALELAQPLPAKPVPLSGWRRWLAEREVTRARCSQARDASPANRWNAGMRELYATLRLERGTAFGRIEGERIVAHFARTFPDAVVVQIGANDGTTGDPLVQWYPQTRWRALLVEPIGHLVESLIRLHAGRSHVTIERAAISEANGHARIYRLAHEPGVSPGWHQLLATFDRNLLLKHRDAIPNLEALIREETVETLTVASLLARHQIEKIDLLVIDTEGHDFRILKQFALRRLGPALIIFEHQHLTPEEKTAVAALLRSHRYLWIETPEGDTFAWRTV